MTDEKWEQLVEMIKQHFTPVKQWQEDIILETEAGSEKRGIKEIVEFLHPTRINYRLVRESRPLVLEKKEHFSHRMGDTARVEYKHSQTEFTHKLKVYKETNFDEWEEITLDRLGL
jgi:hypothetical protein